MKTVAVDESSIFQVSRHLALILLLASGRRVHDLTLLRIGKDKMTLNEKSVTFWPDFGSKTDRGSYRQSGWFLSKISDTKLDPDYWTEVLVNLSGQRRNAVRELDALFITTRGRVAPASRAVIAGWIITTFSSLNITFPLGSIRSAVASARRDNNVPLDSILKSGNWSSDRNVIKHYFKEIVNVPMSAKDNSVKDLVITSFSAV